jgi:hypothetical protein
MAPSIPRLQAEETRLLRETDEDHEHSRQEYQAATQED